MSRRLGKGKIKEGKNKKGKPDKGNPWACGLAKVAVG
jgi:hypothetical protein